MYRQNQMARIIQVAHFIHHEPRKWTRPRLAEKFKVNKTTIQRDIENLRQMEIEIVANGKLGYEMISDFFLPDLNFEFKEALALVSAANFYRTTEGKQVIEILDRAINKITSNLPKGTNETLNRIVPRIEVPPRQISLVDEKQSYKDDLYLAIRGQLKVAIEYNSFSSRKKTRHRLSPYAVIFLNNAWYVIGWSEKHKQVRTFRINRIQSLQILQSEYKIPSDFSVQKYFEKSWDIMTGPDTDVEILFAPCVIPLIREVSWHPTQQIHVNSEGKLHFKVTVAGWEEIGRWVLRWGHDAEVIKPKVLREWVAQTAEKMINLYKEN